MNGWPNRLAAGALAALTAAACGDSEPQVPTERSNLVLITVSSLRADHLGSTAIRATSVRTWTSSARRVRCSSKR